MAKPTARTFTFKARLERPAGSWFTFIAIPAAISRAAGKRGPVPVVALIEGRAEVRASILPVGDGRHRLTINRRARDEAGVDADDRVFVELRLDENPRASELPDDLVYELRKFDVLGPFERLPVGKQNHIVHWIDQAVAETTRDKRIAKAVEVALGASEREFDRATEAFARRAKRRQAEGGREVPVAAAPDGSKLGRTRRTKENVDVKKNVPAAKKGRSRRGA
jgi:hypothetical protein